MVTKYRTSVLVLLTNLHYNWNIHGKRGMYMRREVVYLEEMPEDVVIVTEDMVIIGIGKRSESA